MATPNIQVLKSLFETYVNVRAKKWGIDPDAPSHVLIASIPKTKLDTIIELLNRFKDTNSFADWIQAIYLCADKERSEEVNETINKPFLQRVFFSRKKEFLLKKTIYAAQACIIAELINDERYDKTIKALEKEKSDLEKKMENDGSLNMSEKVINENNVLMKEINQKLEALNLSPNYTKSYFHDIILARDPNVKLEQCFADYVKNATNGSRPYTICPKLVGNIDNTAANDPSNVESQRKSNEHNQHIDNNAQIKPDSNPEDNNHNHQPKVYKPNSTPLGSQSTFARSEPRKIPIQSRNGHSNHTYNLRNR